MAAARLTLSGIYRSFGENEVLRNVSLSLPAGKLIGVVGPNGAGKTTLLRIVAGLLRPTAGTVAIDGVTLTRGGVREARRRGIGYIAQDLSQIDAWTVKQQLQHELSDADRRSAALEIAECLGGELDPARRIETMSAVERQVLEIAKGLARRCAVLLIDEPTTGLETGQRDVLYEHLRRVTAAGGLVLAVSHDLARLRRVSDAFVLVSEGNAVLTDNLPVSAPMPTASIRDAPWSGGWDITRGKLSVRVGHGEVVGIHGALRTGIQDLLRSAFGLGEICVVSKGAAPWTGNVRTSIARGIAYISRDRAEEWGFQNAPMWLNLIARRFASQGALEPCSDKTDRRAALQIMRDANVRPALPDLAFENFSGGNRQKAIVASALRSDATLLLLDEPLSGIDQEARAALGQSLREFVAAGRSALVYSQELDDLRSVCTRTIEFQPAGEGT